MSLLGAIDRDGFRFEPEFSVISQNGAVHVYKNGTFVEELKFQFNGELPAQSLIEDIVDQYCNLHNIN